MRYGLFEENKGQKECFNLRSRDILFFLNKKIIQMIKQKKQGLEKTLESK